MRKDDNIYLEDIQVAIGKIESYIENTDFDQFSKDSKTQDAVIRQLEIIGEASNKLSMEFVNKYPEFPVRKAKNMRNLLAHEYNDVDIAEVWKTAKNDLPLLKNYFESEKV